VGVVNREAAQEPRDRTSSQSWSSDGRERCAGSDAIAVVVRRARKLMLVREEATKSRMRNLIRICGQRRCFRAFFDARPFCSSLPHSLSLSAPHFLRHIHVDATRSKYIKVRRDQVQRQRRTPQDSRIFEHLAKLTRQRSRDGGRRPRADIWWCALYDHPER
jgi:hypothetical protein